MDQPPEFITKLENLADRLRRSAFKTKPTPISPFGTPYASFHRRMIAATLDTLVLSFTIFPLSYWLTNFYLGQIDTNLAPLVNELQYLADPMERSQAIQRYVVDQGRLEYFLTNTIIQLIGIFIYTIFFWLKYQATPGKMAMRIVVVDEKTGGTLTKAQAWWRCVGYILATIPLCLGVIWIALDKKAQGWHDKLGGTIVIVKPKKNPAFNQEAEEQEAEEQDAEEQAADQTE